LVLSAITPAGGSPETGSVTDQSPWENPAPRRRMRRQDKAEMTIAGLLLAGLLGLLLLDVIR
jgi:hypothetical protein